jgi:Holliday junction resolvase RusA-like endonuclease
VVFDPCRSTSKAAFRYAVRQSLADCDVTHSPIFLGKALKLSVLFYVENDTKDVDNLRKFVSDALEMVVYSNNKSVYDVRAHKIPVNKMEDKTTLLEVKELCAS